MQFTCEVIGGQLVISNGSRPGTHRQLAAHGAVPAVGLCRQLDITKIYSTECSSSDVNTVQRTHGHPTQVLTVLDLAPSCCSAPGQPGSARATTPHATGA